eukprot:COSAG06_NODE_929_length_11465_cov_4.106722_4_plen_322_part_00
MELPVIVTDFSGPKAYLTDANGYPLKYRAPYSGSGGLATPDTAHLRQLMRRVTTHREEAVGRGRVARRDMVASYSPAVVLRAIEDRLRNIALGKPKIVPASDWNSGVRRKPSAVTAVGAGAGGGKTVGSSGAKTAEISGGRHLAEDVTKQQQQQQQQQQQAGGSPGSSSAKTAPDAKVRSNGAVDSAALNADGDGNAKLKATALAEAQKARRNKEAAPPLTSNGGDKLTEQQQEQEQEQEQQQSRTGSSASVAQDGDRSFHRDTPIGPVSSPLLPRAATAHEVCCSLAVSAVSLFVCGHGVCVAVPSRAGWDCGCCRTLCC